MARTLGHSIVSLYSNERGTSLIEFTLAVPIFAMLVVGIGDLARGFSEKYALQQAANRTIEMAHLGSTSDNYEYLRVEAAAAAASAGATGAAVTLNSWRECNGNPDDPKPWVGTCPDGEQTARYITLTIRSTFKPAFGSIGYPGANADGTVPITASASLRVQ
jgi:Flp pilus assembly protein TadG